MNSQQSSKLNIVMAVMPQSPFNSSIWRGLAHGFQSLKHRLMIVDSEKCPGPGAFAEKVDLFFAVHGAQVPQKVIGEYRDQGATTGVYLLDEPYEIDRTVQWARHYDYVFSVDRVTVPVHQKYTNAEFLPLAFSDAIFSNEGPKIDSDILVLGSAYKAREIYLAALRDNFGSQVTWVGPGWKSFSATGIHHESYVNPADCARLYRGAKLVINIHRDSTWSHFGELNKSDLVATHLNPRFWEGTASGSLQLVSYRSDLELYAPDAASFDSKDVFLELVEKYLYDDEGRELKARGVTKGIEQHTYKNRAAQIIGTMV
jgi:spore maturation protein CgeB